jgi:NOL1/NOP2/fmu family ribosome biogenesis protein
LALSIFLNKDLPSIQLDLTQAKQFLRKDNLHIPEAPLGWQLVKFNGFALGWVKVLGNRINNYLPAAYRVLKAI